MVRFSEEFVGDIKGTPLSVASPCTIVCDTRRNTPVLSAAELKKFQARLQELDKNISTMSMGIFKCMKYILMISNTIMMLLGCVGLGLGVWALLADFGAEEMKYITGSDVYEAASYSVMVGSGIIFVLSFIGCCGAWFENKCLLGFYFVTMLMFMCVFVVAAVSIFFFRKELEDELASDMEETLLHEYGNLLKADITRIWDKMQQKLGCCGVRGDRNSGHSWDLWQHSQWHANLAMNNNRFKDVAVPMSCCVRGNDCQSYNDDPNMAPQINSSYVTKENPYLNEHGCIDRLKEETNDYLMAIGVTAVASFAMMFFCVVFSVCVCTHGTEDTNIPV